ncbi:MAG: hypothetical protein LIO62_02930 [Clostridiales bacterium]|nr:hypothetical protein [Clostridiales bacterium]
MTTFYDFLGKKVQIIDVDGIVWRGNSIDVCDAEDNNDGEDSIIIRLDSDVKSLKAGALVDFLNSEIKSISLSV